MRLDRPEVYRLEGAGLRWVAVEDGPGRAIAPTAGLTLTLSEAEDEIFSANLDRLRLWSLIAVVGLAAGSGVGGYILSGMMLRPVRDIAEVASEISASNLNRRINHQGPDDELKALADTFDSMIDRLEYSFEQQRRFVQDASHELRTPLAAIRTNIEVAEMDPDLTADDYRALLETIKAQTERLTRLSEDLLMLSATEREAPETEPTPLDPLLREVVRQLEPLAATRGIELRVVGDREVEAYANGDMLYRCVFNLVDNAIKYSGGGRFVTIRAAREGAAAVVSVTDEGPGISPEQQARIFDRFYRVDAGRARRDGGAGLGLAIVRELVEGMGGAVQLESEPGRGSTFTIRLPLVHAAVALV